MPDSPPEKKFKVVVLCPPRDGFHGFGSARMWFPIGRSDHELTESKVNELKAEIARKESILAVEVLGEVGAAPSEAPAPPVPAAPSPAAAEAVPAPLPQPEYGTEEQPIEERKPKARK